MIESGLVKPRDGESKTKAINRISEEIFFKKLQEYFAKQNPITNPNDDFDDLRSPNPSLLKIVLWLISLPFCILISFNAGMTEIPQSLVLLPCIFGIIVFSRTPYFLFGILSLSFYLTWQDRYSWMLSTVYLSSITFLRNNVNRLIEAIEYIYL